MDKKNEKHQMTLGMSPIRKLLSSQLTTTVIIFVAIIIITSLGTIKPEYGSLFLKSKNLVAVFRGMSFYVIAAMGMTLTLMIAEIDISIGSVAGMAAILMTFFSASPSNNMGLGLPPVIAIVLTMIITAVVGMINGFLVVKLKLPPFVATIASLYYARAIAMIITQGYPVYPIPEAFVKIGSATPLGLSWPIIISILLVIAFEFVLRKTSFGRSILATGDNKEVAQLAGINVTRTKITCFIISSVLAGISGMLLAMQLESGQPTIGQGWELQAIAGCAIGGISLLGGAGSFIGTFLGVAIMNVLNNALILFSVNTHYQNLVVGIVMVLAVTFDIYRRNRKLRS
ncbi:MAG: ABC transporter permease [Eubacteriales bacterium]|nr:ABC transporter permease [Eubacteriales bacterium]